MQEGMPNGTAHYGTAHYGTAHYGTAHYGSLLTLTVCIGVRV